MSELGPYTYRRSVAFHETDAMRVVHHSNYVKYYEEARVHWLRSLGISDLHAPKGPYIFAVLDLQCRYMKPVTFEDELEILVQGKVDGLRMIYQYALRLQGEREWRSTGTTTLVPLGTDLNLVRMPKEIRQVFEGQPWSEVWPPSQPSA